MPSQTRSQAAAASNTDEDREPRSPPRRRDVDNNSGSSDGKEHPPHESASTASDHESAARNGGSDSHRYASPGRKQSGRAASGSRSRAPISTPESARRTWQDRGRYRQPPHAPGPQDHLFSPPPYKSERLSHTPREQAMDGHHYDQLDLNEDLGPEVEDTFLFGSFAEDSPPRAPRRSPEPESERKRAPSSSRRSPQPPPHSYYYPPSGATPHHYRRSGRDGSYHPTTSSHGQPPAPPPYHYYPPPPPHGSPPEGYGPPRSPRSYGYYHGYPSHYYYHPEQQHWEGGHYPPTPFEHDDDIPPPPPSTAKKHPVSERPQEDAARASPQAERKSRSPFRSPPPSQNKQKYRRSPPFTPHLPAAGSFGMMDTPGALAPATFSPMPSFAEWDDGAPPFPLGGDFGAKISLSRSNSTEENETPLLSRRRTKQDPSPSTGFMGQMSPFEIGIPGVTRSPLHHSAGYDDIPRSVNRDRARPPPQGIVTREDSRDAPSRRAELDSAAKPRKLWPAEQSSSSDSRSHRLEFGGSGSSSTRRTLEGINSMMHGRHGPVDSTPSRHSSEYSTHGPAQTPHHHAPPPPHYRNDMATPIKSSGRHGYQYRHTPTRGHGHPYPPGSASKMPYGPGSHSKDYPGSDQKKPIFRAPTLVHVPQPGGKENKKKQSPQKSLCNCKKSKCLKLYCECFAAERFCSGCNCSDCGNTPTAGAIRDKAIKDTRAKNPNAFKPRIGLKAAAQTGQGGHNMGCKCKRSECLKKYCECFQAGVMCGGKCKCVDCLNFAGSQALIDKRRKIKDTTGAAFAMRVSDENWKRRTAGTKRPAPSSGRRGMSPSRHMPPPHMMHPSPRGHPHHPPPPHYMGHPMMMAPPPMGYSPMGMPMTPAGYPNPPHHMAPGYPPPPTHHSSSRHSSRHAKSVTPGSATPKTPGVRVEFDPASSRKKRKLSPGDKEPTSPVFGKSIPEQPKTTALAIFSFLSNDDLYNAGLVCKKWSELAMDDELWKFQS